MGAQHLNGLKGEIASDCAAEIQKALLTVEKKTPPHVIEKVPEIKTGERVLGEKYHECLCCCCSVCLGGQLEHVCGGRVCV